LSIYLIDFLQTILAPIGMISLLRFAYQLFRELSIFYRKICQLRHNPDFAFIYRAGNRLVTHANMEILYVNHILAAIILSFFDLLTHITFWGSLIIRYSPECDIRYTAAFCIALNTPVHVCTHAVALSLFFLCLERTCSTLFFRSYESVGSKIPKVMVILQVRSVYNKPLVYRERYQLDENVRSLRTIFPTIIMHTICFFIPNAISLLIFLIVEPRKSEAVIINLLLNWLPYYGVLLPLLMKNINKRASRVQKHRMIKNRATGSAMQNNYFEELNLAWK
ncbi:hypothetical protein PENTCL1PPCAC_741, partial [Pristionchus entomophagus]